MPATSSSFQINDIILDIAPKNIQINQRSYNNALKTLRTRSSMKTKSGFSTIDISITCEFTDDQSPNNPLGVTTNGYDKLRDLVSQLRATPFCYVENDLLRKDIAESHSEKNMALVLRQMEIVKNNDDTNVITAYMLFSWLNYFPYLKEFAFKKDIYSSQQVMNPAESRAWKLFYKAEQIKNKYLPVKKFNEFDDVRVTAQFDQYATVTVKRYQDLEKEVKALQTLRAELSQLSPSSEGYVVENAVQSNLAAELGDIAWAKTLVREIFGDTTSMVGSQDTNVLQKVLSTLDQNLSPESEKYQFITNQSAWGAVILKDGGIVTIPGRLFEAKDPNKMNEFKDEDTVLLKRRRFLYFEDEDLIVQGISISFENELAVMPVIGYSFPTYQYIGSSDARVEISIVTANEDALVVLKDFYSVVQNQALKYRKVPAGHRNIVINNDLINMCGLKEFIPEGLITNTVEGSPGTYEARLILLDNPLTPETQERLTSGQSFTTSLDVRLKLAEIFEQNLKFESDKFYEVKESFFSGKKEVVVKGGYKTEVDTEEVVSAGALSVVTSLVNPVVGLLALGPTALLGAKGIRQVPQVYKYTGPRLKTKEKFQKATELYGIHLGALLIDLVSIVQSTKEGSNAKAIYDLTNADVISIERLQEDLSPIFDLNKDISKNADPTYTTLDVAVNQAKLAAIANPNPLGILAAFASPFVIEAFNKKFAEWDNFVHRFFDAISRDDDFLSQKEFDSVRDLIASKGGAISSSDCYPDLPLKQVVTLLSSSKDETERQTYIRLNALYNESGLALKNAGVSSLIDPDFYLFNPQNDVINDIIPSYIIVKAKDSIIQARKAMFQAEKNWFGNIYEKNIIGQKKANVITDTVLEGIASLSNNVSERVSTFFKTGGGQVFINNAKKQLNNHHTAVNTLVGSIGPSLYEAARRTDPVLVKPIKYQKADKVSQTKGADTQNLYMNYRDIDLTIQKVEGSEVVRHRFDTEAVLEYLPESEYRDEPLVLDPNKEPSFRWPTPSWAHRITSPFGHRDSPTGRKDAQGNIKRENHKGIDLAAQDPVDSPGTPIYAAESGQIVDITKGYLSVTDSTVSVKIEHSGGYHTVYKHLQWDSTFVQGFSDIFHRAAQLGISSKSRSKILSVLKGQQIGLMGNTGFARGQSTGTHLHFEIHKNGIPINPKTELDGISKSQDITIGLDPNNESLLQKSVQQFSKELLSGQGFGLKRAYPAFKLYFIESDLGERKKFAFDDFFNYSAVESIVVVRSRKIPADLCVISLTNISGVLNNRSFYDVFDPSLARGENGKVVKEDEEHKSVVNTAKENPIASLMLQEGTQIQLRLGFSNNPQELERVFNGAIVNVEFSNSTDMVTIVCQGFAYEMTQTVQGEMKSYGGFLSNDGRTFKILNELVASPELVHFGRWEGGDFGKNTQYGLLHSRWKFNPRPSEDNLFPPQGDTELGVVDYLLNPSELFTGTPKYMIYNSTIWDAIQELTYRHPSYIASVVPYEGEYGPRATLFFGLPDQLYFARDATTVEKNRINRLREIVQKGISDDVLLKTVQKLQDPSSNVSTQDIDNAVAGNITDKKAQDEWIKRVSKQYALDSGFIKPFRSYHVLTSAMHIIDNSIHSAAHNAFNTVTVQYSEDNPDMDEKTGTLRFDDVQTFTQKADAGIPDEDTREVIGQFPNCAGFEMAKLYSLSLLAESLRDVYAGSITIIGNAKIRPYSICYIFDQYNGMYGPIEVEQVIHRFSRKNGFITEITPDLCVHVNQESTLSTGDAMGLIAEHGLRSIGMPEIAIQTRNTLSAVNALPFEPIAKAFFNRTENALGIKGETSPLGMLGTFIFSKLITRTQLAHPFRFSPLVLDGKAMIGGLPNKDMDGSFIQQGVKWVKDSARTTPLLLKDTYDRLKPENWYGHQQGDFNTYVFGNK